VIVSLRRSEACHPLTTGRVRVFADPDVVQRPPVIPWSCDDAVRAEARHLRYPATTNDNIFVWRAGLASDPPRPSVQHAPGLPSFCAAAGGMRVELATRMFGVTPLCGTVLARGIRRGGGINPSLTWINVMSRKC
jgi:hypothetical protein